MTLTVLTYYNVFLIPKKFQCMGVTWYLSDDMQMYWYAPLVMIPIWWLFTPASKLYTVKI